MSVSRRITIEMSDFEWDLFQLWRKKIQGDTKTVGYFFMNNTYTPVEENEAVEKMMEEIKSHRRKIGELEMDIMKMKANEEGIKRREEQRKRNKVFNW